MTYRDAVRQFKRELLTRAVQNGVSRGAHELQLARSTLYRLLNELNVKRPRYPGAHRGQWHV